MKEVKKHRAKRFTPATAQEALDKLPTGKIFVLEDALQELGKIGLNRNQVVHLLRTSDQITKTSYGTYKKAPYQPAPGHAPISELVPELEEIKRALQAEETLKAQQQEILKGWIKDGVVINPINGPAPKAQADGNGYDFGVPTTAFAMPRKTAEDELLEKLAAKLKDFPTETILLGIKSHVLALRGRGWEVKVKIKNQW